LVYWLKNNKTWDWLTTLPLIIVMSTATTAYGWTHDVSIIVFSVVVVAFSFNFRKWTAKSIIIFSSFWVANFLTTFMSLPQHWFWWLSSYYLFWYICADYWIVKTNRKMIQDHFSLIEKQT
jgi:hypothetical protein